MSKRILVSSVVCGLVLLSIMSVNGAPPPHNPGVLPPQANAYGMSYGEWGARWWQWAFSLPVTDGDGNVIHPLFDPTGEFAAAGQSGHFWFLGGSFADATVVRHMTIPAGTALFFPIANAEASGMELGDLSTPEAVLRVTARAWFAPAYNLFCVVDGVPIGDLAKYRVESRLFSFGPLPAYNVLALWGNAPEGTVSPAISDGVYLMLAPLPVGKHSIHLDASSASGGTPAQGDFTMDITYDIIVVPGKCGR